VAKRAILRLISDHELTFVVVFMATYTLIVCRFGVEIGSMTRGTLHSDMLPNKLKTGFVVVKAVKLHIPEIVC